MLKIHAKLLYDALAPLTLFGFRRHIYASGGPAGLFAALQFLFTFVFGCETEAKNNFKSVRLGARDTGI